MARRVVVLGWVTAYGGMSAGSAGTAAAGGGSASGATSSGEIEFYPLALALIINEIPIDEREAQIRREQFWKETGTPEGRERLRQRDLAWKAENERSQKSRESNDGATVRVIEMGAWRNPLDPVTDALADALLGTSVTVGGWFGLRDSTLDYLAKGGAEHFANSSMQILGGVLEMAAAVYLAPRAVAGGPAGIAGVMTLFTHGEDLFFHGMKGIIHGEYVPSLSVRG